MQLDILTFGEALVEVMRTDVDQPLDQPAPFEGPYPSGAPFIFAVQAARLGARVGCIGCIGDDAFGRCLLRQLQQDGVETSVVHTLAGYTTGVAFIAYNGDGSRDYVFHMRHAAAGQLSRAHLERRSFDGLKLLHVTGSSLAINDEALALGLQAVEYARASGARISFDPNLRPQLMSVERAREAFAPFVAAADVILPTADEALLLMGATTLDEAVGTLMGADLHRVVVISQGSAGCTVYTAHGSQHIPAYRVDEIDPTGAGDCFDAGFLVRWLEGAAPADAARFGGACGALAVTARGPMAGAKRRAEVERFMSGGG